VDILLTMLLLALFFASLSLLQEHDEFDVGIRFQDLECGNATPQTKHTQGLGCTAVPPMESQLF
jgi:hypothetical protein